MQGRGVFQVKQLQVGGLDHNFSYLISATDGSCAWVDPAGDFELLRRAWEEVPGKHFLRYVLLTHAHKDHTEQLLEVLRQWDDATRIVAHPLARIGIPFAPTYDGEELPFGGGFIEVIFTPGHTPDSVSYNLSGWQGIFTGDTLFVDDCGFASDERSLYESLQHRLFPLPNDIPLYSGHDYGHTEVLTLGEAKSSNPFLQPQSFEEFSQRLKTLS